LTVTYFGGPHLAVFVPFCVHNTDYFDWIFSMIAILMAVSVVNLSGLTVTAPVDPDANLVSRNILPDGTVGECRRVMEDRPGWLPFRCETGPFVGQSVYRPTAARIDAAWTSPRPIGAADHGTNFVIWKGRDAAN
jgi:hypothetical protein